MSLLRLFFPERYRGFRGKRWISIALRTAHLVGITGLGGAWVAGDAGSAQPYLALTVASGALMLAIEIWSSAVYVLQVRGLAMLVKVALLSTPLLAPVDWGALILVAVLISGVFAHAPARVRYYSPFHGRVIDNL